MFWVAWSSWVGGGWRAQRGAVTARSRSATQRPACSACAVGEGEGECKGFGRERVVGGGAENALGRVRCHKILARAARNVGCRRVRRWAGQAGGSEELLWAARGCEAAVVVEAAVVAEVGEVREAVE